MNPAARLVVSLFVRLGLLFFAGWFAVVPDALHPDASLVSRIGLALLFLIASILVGEVASVRMHFGMLLSVMRNVGAGAGGVVATAVAEVVGDGASKESVRDPRDSIDVLVRALGSTDAETRTRAHAHLMRLTGEDLPPDIAVWQAWWAENREGFGR